MAEKKSESLVCFCYRYTAEKLKREHDQYGSLAEFQKQTKVGLGCGGCRQSLYCLFDEVPYDPSDTSNFQAEGTVCVKPGTRTQKGFVVSDGNLESTIIASNAIAPMLGECNSTVNIDYTFVNQEGFPVFRGEKTVQTNETFVLETKSLALPKPFYGTLIMNLDRGNVGAWRYNIYWSNGISTTSTHESGATGRYRAFIPFLVDKRFFEGPNVVYAGIMNCFGQPNPLEVQVFDTESSQSISWVTEMMPNQTAWLNLNESFYREAFKRFGDGSYGLRFNMNSDDTWGCVSVYFFMFNKHTEVWSCNHL